MRFCQALLRFVGEELETIGMRFLGSLRSKRSLEHSEFWPSHAKIGSRAKSIDQQSYLRILAFLLSSLVRASRSLLVRSLLLKRLLYGLKASLISHFLVPDIGP